MAQFEVRCYYLRFSSLILMNAEFGWWTCKCTFPDTFTGSEGFVRNVFDILYNRDLYPSHYK
jgi:hypothetical protein